MPVMYGKTAYKYLESFAATVFILDGSNITVATEFI